MTAAMQIDYLAALVESVTGYAPLTPRRSRPVVEARALLAGILLAQGQSLTAVGDRNTGCLAGTENGLRGLCQKGHGLFAAEASLKRI